MLPWPLQTPLSRSPHFAPIDQHGHSCVAMSERKKTPVSPQHRRNIPFPLLPPPPSNFVKTSVQYAPQSANQPGEGTKIHHTARSTVRITLLAPERKKEANGKKSKNEEEEEEEEEALCNCYSLFLFVRLVSIIRTLYLCWGGPFPLTNTPPPPSPTCVLFFTYIYYYFPLVTARMKRINEEEERGGGMGGKSPLRY